MRSRRRRSRSLDKGCSKRVIVEGLKPPFDKDDSVRAWLARYGTVEGIERFYSSIVVQFSSELQAAEAVRYENGIRGSGSNIKVHLADSDALHQLVQRNPRRKRSLSLQQKRSTSSRSESSTRPARKPRLKTMDSRHSDVKSQLSKHETSVQESKEATTSSQQQHQHHSRSSSDYDVAILAVTHELVQYAETVQTLLNRRAVEEGGALLDQRQGQQQEVPELQIRSPRIKIMVLMSVDHIAPCMQDLGEEGVLFAILLNTANLTHNSCTLRILHSSTQQEHRNMLLPDAIDLLLRDFADYLEVEAASVSLSKATSPLPLPALPSTLQQPRQEQQQMRRRRCRHRTVSSSATSSSRRPHRSRRRSHHQQQRKQSHLHHRHHHPQQQRSARVGVNTFGTLEMETIPAPDDPNFLAPSRHVSVLLRMLADSRILSVGELDEISAFIAQRRARLTGEFFTAESVMHRLPPSSRLYVDTSEALSSTEPTFSSAGEVVVTPDVASKGWKFLHREALVVSRESSNRRLNREV
ncbi:hypothetical protein TcWFU_008110 [Taenia crassiceps]|uniref:RRM domain-containing protein n=1 Tax=Taenia crassiceps TaxID=6207 RepID=A0ABR4QBE6_9CEST